MERPDQAFYAIERSVPQNYFCEWAIQTYMVGGDQEVHYRISVQRDGDTTDEVMLRAIGPAGEQLYTDLTTELVLSGADVEEIKVLARNGQNRPERSAFTVQIVEDFRISGRRDLSSIQFLAYLSIAMVVVCLITIIGFIGYSRTHLEAVVTMTEGEKRYLRIYELRRDVKKSEKLIRFLDKKSEEYRVEQRKLRDFTAQLNGEKSEQVEEFMRLLETVPYQGDGTMSYRISECSICMDGYARNETVYRIPTCQHMFHEECLRNWLLQKNQEAEQRCPFCNQALDITELRERQKRIPADVNFYPSPESDMKKLADGKNTNKSMPSQVTPAWEKSTIDPDAFNKSNSEEIGLIGAEKPAIPLKRPKLMIGSLNYALPTMVTSQATPQSIVNETPKNFNPLLELPRLESQIEAIDKHGRIIAPRNLPTDLRASIDRAGTGDYLNVTDSYPRRQPAKARTIDLKKTLEESKEYWEEDNL